MNKYKKIPELLAPAGSLAAGLAAFDCGADAVYAGLAKFNARERTENFTLEEMSKLITYAHNLRKKVYLTFNTLIKESELIEAAENICEVSKLKPDAIIVQDLGILRMIREYFPFLDVHASTQMGIHNSAGINLLAKRGVKRVIIERQVTIDELEAIIKNSRIQVEVFIHGALCCSMSGNCLLSSWHGGYSGNRGKCKQPCRKLYRSDSGGQGYYLSTKDLCSLEAIGAYKRLHVTSLKIEGRLKKPDYVSSVVSAYRLVLDSDENDTAAMQKARDILSRSPGRKWCGGFRTIEALGDVIEHENLGISGQLYGKVTKIKPGGFEVLLSSNIHIGDRIRVQPKTGEEGPALTVSKLIHKGSEAVKVRKGEFCFIKTDKEIPSNSSVFKIGESGGDQLSRIANLPIQSYPIDISISVRQTGISIYAPVPVNPVKWTKEYSFALAEKHPTRAEVIETEFKASSNETYKAGKINVAIDGNLFIPSSVLKQIRREFWDYLTNRLTPDTFHQDSINGLVKFKDDYNREIKKLSPASCTTTSLLPADKMNPVENSILCHTLDEFNPSTEEIILPEYCFEHDIDRIRRKIRRAVDQGKKRFRITSLYAFELLKDFKGIVTVTSYPLPAANSLAVKEIEILARISSIKLISVQAWLELEKEQIMNFKSRVHTQLELYSFGRPHLLITRARIPVSGIIYDFRNNRFFFRKDKQGVSSLFSGKVFQTENLDGFSYFYDLANTEIDETDVHSFNFNSQLF